jgi:hypothetical protein
MLVFGWSHDTTVITAPRGTRPRHQIVDELLVRAHAVNQNVVTCVQREPPVGLERTVPLGHQPLLCRLVGRRTRQTQRTAQIERILETQATACTALALAPAGHIQLKLEVAIAASGRIVVGVGSLVASAAARQQLACRQRFKIIEELIEIVAQWWQRGRE